jgi:hypothetical protein
MKRTGAWAWRGILEPALFLFDKRRQWGQRLQDGGKKEVLIFGK